MKLNILKELNDEQKEAVMTTEGYVRVIAGAGSGKTKALTSRYIYIVNELGVSTANILCVTFTNKAAKEMKKRIRNIIGDNDTGMICTFHSFCRQMLREDIHSINYPNNFIVMDKEDINTVLKIIYEQANISSRQYTFSMMQEMISKRKMSMEHIPYIIEVNSELLKEKFLYSENIEDRIFFGYLYHQRKSFNLDFNDLITFAVYILNTFREKRIKWQKRLEYVMVDEFQDVSNLQYDIASILSGYHKNLFVVGDPDQTIYSWRGARIEYILNFDKMFPNVKTIFMTKNYRSTENILNASNSLIDKNENRIKKDLIAIKKSEDRVVYNHSKTIYDEARWIAKQVKDIKNNGKEYNDICILYRAHYVSRSIEEAFIKEDIPYVLYSGVGFYERKEIKDILSYLRMIVFEDDLSFIRIINEPKRNFGKKRMEIVQAYAEKNNCSLFNSLKYNIDDKLISNSKAREFVELIEKYQKNYKEMTITDLLTEVLNSSGYEKMLRLSGEDDRLDNLAELKSSIVDYEVNVGEETSLEDYLQEIALYTNSDLKEESDKVKMMTIHTAKGLEFPYVFISGLNEGIFPSSRANTKDKLEEERRLAYVGYTRAEKVLFLSESEGINYNGSFRYPSRFIFNTDKKYLNYISVLEKNLIEDANEHIDTSERKFKVSNSIKFNKGDTVTHSLFGIGVIKEINYENSSYIIKFEKRDTERNISFATKLVKGKITNNLNDEKKKTELKLDKKSLQESYRRREDEIVQEIQELIRKRKEKIVQEVQEFLRKKQEEISQVKEKLIKGKVQEITHETQEFLRKKEMELVYNKQELLIERGEEGLKEIIRKRRVEIVQAKQEFLRKKEEEATRAIHEFISIKVDEINEEKEELIRKGKEELVEEIQGFFSEKENELPQDKQEFLRILKEKLIQITDDFLDRKEGQTSGEKQKLLRIREEARRIEEERIKVEEETRRMEDARIRSEKDEILQSIQEQELIIKKYKFSLWGKGASIKKEAKEKLIILKYKLTAYK
ncbi:ATP-dependent DNA helicase pcrA [uncultured Clostridium sp.]|uniref:ATP-dependent helicase n=1 Tax=uncultured Clostridium sp. TaxID=59620 RepID=UPI00082171DC|nr:UvrD-helicase domain-containing protein [uncultured Clostridium sp.]SCJ97193.1 ATP-dependent DNA helicase pcrA [uncultured Clostridium sp.]